MPIGVPTRKPASSATARRRCWKARISSALGIVEIPSRRTPRESTRIAVVASGALSRSAIAGAVRNISANQTALLISEPLTAVGVIRSTACCQRITATLRPISFMLRTIVITSRAAA